MFSTWWINPIFIDIKFDFEGIHENSAVNSKEHYRAQVGGIRLWLSNDDDDRISNYLMWLMSTNL